MITEFMYSIAILCLIVKAIIILSREVNIKYDDNIYLSTAISSYFTNGKCLNKVKCSKNYILYKKNKIIIKNYETNTSFRSKFDEDYKKIFEEYEKKINTISK